MKKLPASVAFLASASLLAAPARADVPETTALRDWIVEHLVRARAAVEGDAAPVNADDDFRLRRFSVNLRASAGLEVPGVGTARVTPEIELMWEREAD